MSDASWNAFWRIATPRPDGSRAPDGPLIEALEDKFEFIASGQAVGIVPADPRADSIRPDLTTVPLHGVEPSHVVLATRADDRSRLVAAFRKCAQATWPLPCLRARAAPCASHRPPEKVPCGGRRDVRADASRHPGVFSTSCGRRR